MSNGLRKNTMIYTIGNIVYMFSQWVITVITVKFCGFQSAGLLSLAMSITAAPAIVTLFNIRNYQVSDTDNRFDSRAYIASRHITCVLSFMVCCAIILGNHYSTEKADISLLYMLLKLIEGYVDVYAGIEHKYNRLDLAGISALVRGLGTMIIYVVVLAVTGNMTLGIMSILIVCASVLLVFDRRCVAMLIQDECVVSGTMKQQVMEILKVCFPLAVVAFLNNLSISVPRLILEKSRGETLLGVFNSVSSPTIVIQVILTSMFAPWIPILSKQYLHSEREFASTIKHIFLVTVVLSVGGMVAVYIMYRAGVIRFAMRLLFNSEIDNYIFWFVPICLLSGITVINSCLFSICTLMRKVQIQYIIGIIGLAASYLFSRVFIPSDGIRGLIIATTISLVMQIIIQVIIIIHGYHKRFC